MRVAGDIDALGGILLATRAASGSQLLVDEPGDLGPVGAALGLAHHVPHDRADRLRIARPHALRGVGVGLKRGRNHRGQLVQVTVMRNKQELILTMSAGKPQKN